MRGTKSRTFTISLTTISGYFYGGTGKASGILITCHPSRIIHSVQLRKGSEPENKDYVPVDDP